MFQFGFKCNILCYEVSGWLRGGGGGGVLSFEWNLLIILINLLWFIKKSTLRNKGYEKVLMTQWRLFGFHGQAQYIYSFGWLFSQKVSLLYQEMSSTWEWWRVYTTVFHVVCTCLLQFSSWLHYDGTWG